MTKNPVKLYFKIHIVQLNITAKVQFSKFCILKIVAIKSINKCAKYCFSSTYAQ